MQKNIDIFDKNNQSTGKQTSIDDAMRRGLWYRCVHITVVTKGETVLLQKRSHELITQPGLLDISCGGVVDAGELPEQAAIRELSEEVGITIKPSSLKFSGTYRLNHAYPRLRKMGRSTVYCYILVLPGMPALNVQREEVEWAKFVPLRDAKRLIKRHSLRGLGRLVPRYRMYHTQLKTAQKLVEQTYSH